MSRLSQMLLVAVCAAGGGWLIAAGAQEQTVPETSRSDAKERPAAESQADAAPRVSIDLTAISERKRAARREIESKLQQRVSFTFKDDVLRDVLAELGRAGGIPVWIDSTALRDEGIDEREPIFIEFRDITIKQALDRVLEPLHVTWVIEDEVLRITTEVTAQEHLSTHIYNVRALLKLKRMPVSSALDEDDLDNGAFTQFARPPRDPRAAGAWIIDALQGFTAGPWFDIDGTGGEISLMKHLLVVRQTQKVQAEVQGLLETLQRAAAGTLEGKSAAVWPAGYPRAEDARIHKALAGKTRVDFRDRPLKSALEEIADHSGITVLIDEQALTDEGVSSDEPVTLHVAELSWHSALKLLLEPLGLAFVVEDGALKVTTKVAADEKLFGMVHDISDLSEAKFDGRPLIQLILNGTSGPWEEVDGTGGTIGQPVTGILLVRQTEQNHAEVAALLADLREHTKERTADAEPARRQPVDPGKVVTQFYPIDPLLLNDVAAASGQAAPEGNRPARTALERAILTFVAPETWKDSGAGGDAALERVNELLVIRQTAGIHEELREFLDGLVSAAQAAANVRQMELSPFGQTGGFGSGGLGGGGFGGGGGGFFRVPAGQRSGG